MPSVDENRSLWRRYHWSQDGEEWSKSWGSARMQWYGSVMPRISTFVPADTILEIAPGYGRWTTFLKDLCRRLVVVDLSENCIARCRSRFAGSPHISYFVNDGRSLDMVPDGAIDFIFSFDSLVHAEDDILDAYVAQFARKLRQDGVAFIHHSNLGEYTRRLRMESYISTLPVAPHLLRLLAGAGLYSHVSRTWRASGMTAQKMALFAEAHGLQCINQELINWKMKSALVDCFSTITPRGSKWACDNRIIENTAFMAEAKCLSKLSRICERTQR